VVVPLVTLIAKQILDTLNNYEKGQARSKYQEQEPLLEFA
jgi:hypothetical protein